MHLFSVAKTDRNNKSWQCAHDCGGDGGYGLSILVMGSRDDRKDTNARALIYWEKTKRGALAYAHSLNKSVIILMLYS